MDAREELATTIRPVLADYGAMGTVPPEHPLGLPSWGDRLSAHESDCPESIADAILAAGYRKMPDREAVIRALAEADEQSDIEGSWKTMEYMYSPSADAILALMEGNK